MHGAMALNLNAFHGWSTGDPDAPKVDMLAAERTENRRDFAERMNRPLAERLHAFRIAKTICTLLRRRPGQGG